MKEKKAKRIKINKNKGKLEKKIKIMLLVLLLALGVLYLLLSVVYESGPFTVTLDESLAITKGLVMYEDATEKAERRILKTESLEFLDNISINWIPKDVHESEGGSNNGDNYIAYTFYIENQGIEPVSYWYSTIIDDVIKNVDEAVRVRIYLNGESDIYAKINAETLESEENTTPFFSDEYVEIEQRIGLMPGDTDKFTIVVWIEGDDPDCLDNLIGGAIKMHMEITQEQIKID